MLLHFTNEARTLMDWLLTNYHLDLLLFTKLNFSTQTMLERLVRVSQSIGKCLSNTWAQRATKGVSVLHSPPRNSKMTWTGKWELLRVLKSVSLENLDGGQTAPLGVGAYRFEVVFLNLTAQAFTFAWAIIKCSFNSRYMHPQR